MTSLLVVFWVAFATPAAPAYSDAADYVSAVVAEMVEDGYGDIRVTKTFWGRVKVVGRKSDLEHVVILNPNTGEYLRDLVRRLRNQNGGSDSGSGSDRHGSGGGGGSDDDDGDDDNSSSGDSGDNGGSDDSGGSDDGGRSDDGEDD